MLNELLKKHDAYNEEPKVTVYVVRDTDCNVGYYLEEDFHKAKEHLVKIITSDNYTTNHISHRPSDSPMIIKISVPQSRIKDYIR